MDDLIAAQPAHVKRIKRVVLVFLWKCEKQKRMERGKI
jgi:hypothetical protein